MGFGTQRQRSDLAIERTTPCLLGLYSMVALLAHNLYLEGRLTVRKSAWYVKEQAAFIDALALSAAVSVGERVFFNLNIRR